MAEQEKTGSSAQRVAGRYEVLGRLGSGPHGPTYRALDHRHLDATDAERQVALKILRARAAEAPDFDQRLRALQAGLGELVDDAIVAPRDCGRTELGLAYLSYELVRGTSLEELLQTEGALPGAQARALIARLAQALETVHARGFAHGALGPQHVLLVDGPDGRVPRVLDVGLAALLEPQAPAPTPRDDVRAIGRLLAAALSGDPSGKTLPAQVDVETVRVLEEALDEDGFQDLRALRAALSDPRPRASEHAPAGPTEVLVRPGPSRRPLFVLTLCLASVAAWGAWSARGKLGAVSAQEHADLEREVARRAERERELEHELAATRTALAERADPALELEREHARLSATVDELGGALAAAREEAESLRAEKGAVESSHAQSEGERAAERARLALLEEERDRALASLRALEEEQEHRRDATDLLAEALRERFAGGDPRAVWSLFESLGADGRLPAGLSASPLVAAWTEAADLERRSADAPVAEIGTLIAQARTALERARAEQDVFVLALRQELGVREPLEGTLEEALRALEDRLEERLAVRDAARQWEWNAVLTAPLDADPAAALALAASFPGQGRARELFAALDRSLRERFEREGELSADELQAAPSLAPWYEAVRAAGGSSASPTTRSIERFAWAQAWAGPQAAELLLARWPPPEREPAPDESCAPGTWQAALVTEVLLLHPEGPHPGAAGRRALYRTLAADGAIGWQIETLVAGGATHSGWTLQQSFYDADGRYKGERSLVVVRRGRTLVEEGVRPRVLFRAGERLRASAAWSGPSDAPPFRLPIGPDAIAAFRERTANAPLAVLVCVEDGGTSLWSAECGLVRHEDPGLVTRELYFAD